MTVGVLALQGDFILHKKMLDRIDVNVKFVKAATDLEGCCGLIIPGGESSVISKLIQRNNLYKNIIDFSKSKTIFGTCAGMIMMSSNVANDDRIMTLNIMDFEVRRNAWGRQYDSFKSLLTINSDEINGIFIRAPKVTKLNNKINIMAKINNEAVLLSDGNHIVSSFHPELTENTLIHQLFIDMINKKYAIA